MDNSLSESARFAVYREKLKGICEANNLSYVFIKNAYPHQAGYPAAGRSW